MKRIILLCILLMAANVLLAPVNKHFAIIESQPINYYDRLIYAVFMVESGGDSIAYNPLEDATGGFQIRPIRLADYNKKTGKSLLLKDCYSLAISKEIFMFYTQGRDYETVAREWNGSGKMTDDYWKRIQKYL